MCWQESRQPLQVFNLKQVWFHFSIIFQTTKACVKSGIKFRIWGWRKRVKISKYECDCANGFLFVHSQFPIGACQLRFNSLNGSVGECIVNELHHIMLPTSICHSVDGAVYCICLGNVGCLPACPVVVANFIPYASEPWLIWKHIWHLASSICCF